MGIDATPLWYAGTKFRSALEADWAATLNALGTAWEYEPETITLPSGAIYIPDFWLPDFGIWLEVKGPDTLRIEKTHELAEMRRCAHPAGCSCEWPGGEPVIIGHPPIPEQENHRRARYGYMSWSPAGTPGVSLGYCRSCPGYSWVLMRRPLMCRHCRTPWSDGHLYSGGGNFHFRRAPRPTDGQ